MSECKREMRLDDTAEMMSSPDYKERFRAEYYQIVIRYRKLKAMLDKWDQDMLDFEPTCPRSTYNMQVKAMTDYIAVLEARGSNGKREIVVIASYRISHKHAGGAWVLFLCSEMSLNYCNGLDLTGWAGAERSKNEKTYIRNKTDSHDAAVICRGRQYFWSRWQ